MMIGAPIHPWQRRVVVPLLLSAMACAGDAGEVDRVQPGFVTKADLLAGHWYYRRTVVDAPENFGAYAAIGTGDLFTVERIRWNIQEDYLFAHRDYEWVPGTDGAEDPGGDEDYTGTPVAAFPIESHFDIQYEYNPETGEQTNVRVENTTDRQWWQRSYMRVDWSKNDNPNIDFILPVDFLDMNRTGGGDFYVHEDDATNPYRARIEPHRGYVDFVVNHFVWPDPYTCYTVYDFDIGDAVNCGAGEIRVRHAFLKVDEAELAGYEPLRFPDSVPLTEPDGEGGVREVLDPSTGEVVRAPVWDRFGFYRLEKLTWDDERGLTESGRLYRAIRFDIWKDSVDETGSSIPYAQRQVEPIVYYTNWDFPEDLQGAAGEVAAEWNRVFQETVALLQGRPFEDGICGGGADPDCNLPEVFILRENSCNRTGLHNYFAAHADVRAAAEAAMGGDWPGADNVALDLLDNWCATAEYFSRDRDDPFTWEQEGDPRYNLLNWINNVTPSGFAGYGPMLADPITGRIVCATTNIMGWTVEASATRALEYIDYMNGDLELRDLLNGEDVPQLLADGAYDPRAYTFAVENALAQGREMVAQEQRDEIVARMMAQGGSHEERMVPLENSAHFAERMARIHDSDIEREYLTRPEDLVLASGGEWVPGMEVSDDLWDAASLVSRRHETMARRDRTWRLLQEHTFLPQANLDDALVGLARRLANLSRDERRSFLKRALFKSVALHEIGHNLGLRHNFEGSMDALNYPRTFWEIETSSLGDEEKLEAGQPEYMYSSIMDYHGKTNADFQGLGLWDRAAIKFGYGQLLETFVAPVAGGATLREWRRDHDYRELLLDSAVDGYDDGHPPYFDNVDAIYERADVLWDWNAEPSGPCVSTADVCGTDQTEVEALLAKEVPYMFCSDEYAQLTPTCKRFDFGANQREVQAAAYTSYKNYFIFSRFLRGRLVLNLRSALARGYAAFRDTMLTYKYMYRDLSRDPEGYAATDTYGDFLTATRNGLNLMSEVISLPQPTVYHRCSLEQTHELEMPEVACGGDGDCNTGAGYTCLSVGGVDKCAIATGIPVDVTYYNKGYIDWDPLVDVSNGFGPEHDPTAGWVENCDMDQELDIHVGEGFPLFFGFSEDYLAWTFTYLGTYWDKVTALDEMTYPFAYFPRANQLEDRRTYSISLYRLYPEELNDVLLGLIENDRRSLASRVDLDNGTVLPRQMIFPEANGGAPKIVPSLVRNMQYFSILFGMAYLTSPMDSALDFSKHARVALKGSADDFPAFDSVPPEDRAECVLPEAGRTFRAIRTASEASDIDIAFNSVQECVVRVSEADRARQAYDDAQAVLDAMSETDPGYDDQEILTEELRLEWMGADAELRTVEQMLTYMRRLHQVFEHGAGY